MSVNTMSFAQIASVLNSIIKQATGQDALTPTNTAEFVSAGQTALALPRDAVMNAISGVIGRTIFAIRPYSAKFAGLEKTPERWGAYMRKLSIADSDWDNHKGFAWPVTYDASQNPPDGEGYSVDQWTVKKPDVLQTNFFGQSVYQDHYSITEEQLETAFRGPEELGSFFSMVTTAMSNRLERAKDSTARGLVANMIGSLVHENNTSRVIHLLTEYNAETGLSLTAQTVYQPDNFPAFTKWLYARIANLSDLMTEASEMYQTVVNSKHIIRHTDVERQKIYLFSKMRHAFDARVLADTFHDSYLRFADVESVNFWQSIETPDRINVTPVYTGANGALVEPDESVTATNILGIMFDDDAAGYGYLDRRYYPTPLNAAGLYRNIWISARQKVFMDNTEKMIVLLLD